MTRKDYEKIAAVFAKTTDYMKEHHKYAYESYALDMADMLQQDNPRFDREKFLKACGVHA